MAAQDLLIRLAARARFVALASAAAAVAALAPTYAGPLDPSSAELPHLILWAWERPEDLRGLDSRVGVAFLAQTIRIGARAFDVAPRRQPLRVSPQTTLIAVTRIETLPAGQPDRVDLDGLASAILRTVTLPRVAGVQIDFDAVVSERTMFVDLLRRVRQKLDRVVPLSITALASWCADDEWMTGLPVDEIVPMLFRMGPANAPYRSLARSARLAQPGCRRAVGTSLDEPLDLVRDGRRVYVFNPTAWTAARIDGVRKEFLR